MPKQAKSVQIRHKVSKYVTNVWRWRTPTGDRSAAAVCLSMVYTVYKGVSLELSAVAADFHYATQIVTYDFTFYRSISFNLNQFD